VILIQFLLALLYTAFGAAVLAEPLEAVRQATPYTWADFWDVVRIVGGAAFGGTSHGVAVWLAGARVVAGKRAPRIAGGALAAAIAVAAVRWRMPAAPLSLEILVAGLAGWLGSQLIENASGEALDGLKRWFRRWVDRLAPPSGGDGQ
jgi:hypothetical protein